MSVLTEVLKLFKYDPATDGDMTFNLTQCLNNNWDKLDAAILLAIAAAGAYNPEESYAVGDYCTYKGKLRKCSTAIPTGETWTEAHWTTTTVAAELAELSSQLSNKVNSVPIFIQPSVDVLTLETGHVYAVEGEISTDYNHPINSSFAHLTYEVLGSVSVSNYGYKVIKCTDAYSGKKWTRTQRWGAWNDWVPDATATPPEEYDIPFRSGWQANGMKATYCKSQEGICIVNCAVYGTGTASDNSIATLPAGFRPNATVFCAAHAHGGGIRGIAEAQIAANGDITIYSPIEFDFVSFGVTFLAQN